MTLQYRTRDMSDDRRWNQRVRLSNCLLMDVVDWWCRDDREFPFESTVASLLYLFSPRCDPFSVSESDLRQTLLDVVDSPSVEYARTWPNHDSQKQSDVITSLSTVLQDTVAQWLEGSMSTPSVHSLNQQVVDCLVDFKYVTFHHNQTTHRDGGGFHGH